MRVSVCAWVLGIAASAVGASAAERVASADPAQALIALETTRVAALQKSDTKILSALCAQTYVDTDESAHRSSKAEVLRTLNYGALKLHKHRLSDMKAYVYGDAAIVTGTSLQEGDFQGQRLPGKMVFTDPFVRHANGWLAVASHRTALRCNDCLIG